MKKTLIIGLGIIAGLAMTSCKSQESAYRKAYLQAQQNQQNQQGYQNQDVIVVDDDDVAVTPVTPVQSQQTTTVPSRKLTTPPCAQSTVAYRLSMALASAPTVSL